MLIALLAQLWSSPFNFNRGRTFVHPGECLCIYIQINLGGLDGLVITLFNFWSCFGSTHRPFSCKEMNVLWGEWSGHTSYLPVAATWKQPPTSHLASSHQCIPFSLSSPWCPPFPKTAGESLPVNWALLRTAFGRRVGILQRDQRNCVHFLKMGNRKEEKK